MKLDSYLAAMSRRKFIRQAACASLSTAAMSNCIRDLFLINSAMGADTTGYKALVCIFLSGGNDSNNLIVPMDSAGYANYSNLRGSQASGGLAIPQVSLQQIGSAGTYGMHPSVPELAGLYNNSKTLAILANVGTLIKPFSSRNDYLTRVVLPPDNLFSHSDQQDQWQTNQLSGVPSTGWGGRMADILIAGSGCSNAAFPPIVSVAGEAIFCTGSQTQPFAMVPGTTPGLRDSGDNSAQGQARLAWRQPLPRR